MKKISATDDALKRIASIKKQLSGLMLTMERLDDELCNQQSLNYELLESGCQRSFDIWETFEALIKNMEQEEQTS